MTSLLTKIRTALDLFASPQVSWGQRKTLVAYLLKTKVLGQDIIRSVELIHTLKCNCRCAFCSNEKLSEEKSLMKREEVLTTIDRVADHGVTAIIFLGGESLTDGHFFEYVAYTKKKGLIPLLQTNGTLLTEQSIPNLSKAGLYSVCITLHDTISEKHDAVVGCPGALDTILRAIPVLKKHHIEVILKTVYSHETRSSGAFHRILALAKNMRVPLDVNPMMPVGRGIGEGNLFSDEEKEDFLRITLSEPFITTHTKSRHDNQCPAGHLYLGILPDGEMIPCYFLPLSVGNIKNTSIQTAQRRAAELGIFKKGTDACIVAMNRYFYNEVIQPLYCGDYDLPVRVHDNPEVNCMISDFAQKHATFTESIERR